MKIQLKTQILSEAPPRCVGQFIRELLLEHKTFIKAPFFVAMRVFSASAFIPSVRFLRPLLLYHHVHLLHKSRPHFALNAGMLHMFV